MSENLPICRNCKYYGFARQPYMIRTKRPDTGVILITFETYPCWRSVTLDERKEDLVHGNSRPVLITGSGRSCEQCREDEGDCGRTGRFFEATTAAPRNAPWWKRKLVG